MLILRVALYSLVVTNCLARRGGSYGKGTSRSRGSSRGIQYTKKASQTGSIERTTLFRSAVFGTTAGYLTFRAGRHFINEPSQAITRMLILILVFSVLGVFFIEAFRWGLNCMYMCKYGHPRECEPLSI
uniref:Ion_trans_2 domain-containing protein n=1 Tax=Heterorhabditis bacteriophora TaxID=37862 RepID=A0A1I7X4Y7_HETBA